MTLLTPLLFVAFAARGHTVPETSAATFCERKLGRDLLDSILTMKTLRHVRSHEGRVPGPALRAILDEYLAGDFPPDVEVHNDSPLPIFEVKAEYRLEAEGSSHKLLVLRASKDSPPAALVHEEIFGRAAPVYLTVPLGEPALREVREALLQVYQIQDRLEPDLTDLHHLALFAEDRLRLDPRAKAGISEAAYADQLEVERVGYRHDDVTRLIVRREDDGGALVRKVDGDLEILEVFGSDVAHRTGDRVARELESLLESAGSLRESLKVFLGDHDEVPDLEILTVFDDHNVPVRALRLIESPESMNAIETEFAADAGAYVRRVQDGTCTWLEVRAPTARLRQLILRRVTNVLQFASSNPHATS